MPRRLAAETPTTPAPLEPTEPRDPIRYDSACELPTMRRLQIFAATTAVVMAPSVLPAHADDLQRAAFHSPAEEVLALADALEERVTVWHRPDGTNVHIGPCRLAPRGCRARVEQLATWIYEAGEQEGIDPWILAAIAFRESGLNPWAVGRAGERGIIQLNPHSREGSRSRFVRDERYREGCRRLDGACQKEVLIAGAQLLARAIRMCGGNLARGLSGYNAGTCAGAPEYGRRILRERDFLFTMLRRRRERLALN